MPTPLPCFGKSPLVTWREEAVNARNLEFTDTDMVVAVGISLRGVNINGHKPVGPGPKSVQFSRSESRVELIGQILQKRLHTLMRVRQ